MIDEKLLSILACPENRTPLHRAGAKLVEQINQAIGQGSLKNKAGQIVAQPVDDLLVREDGVLAYPVLDDVPVLLIDEAIPLNQVQ
jgi:uncharacterized protein YbaR (Trm112 family)